MKAFILFSFLLICGASGLSVFDDNGRLVQVDLKATYPETLQQTEKVISSRVFFYLYTRANPKTPQQLRLNDVATLRRSSFDPKKPTKIVIHGWMNSHNSKVCTLLRDAFLQHGDYNVITLDWGSIAKKPYVWSSNRVKIVAQYTAKMINFLETQGMNVSQLTIAGHSLGAHVAGLSAKYANGKVNYVVGMDPALPNFRHDDPSSRIASGDASYVQIIHTNAGLLGFNKALGDADFYPNGGHEQPGCLVNLNPACSHSRSYELFAESINSKTGFWARKCNSYSSFERGSCKSQPAALMGGIAPNYNVRGTYYLDTNRKSPFAKGAA